MQPLGEFAGMNYSNFDNSTKIQESCWNMMPSTMQTLRGSYVHGVPNFQMLHSEMNPQKSSSFSNNSTSDEADQENYQYNFVDERKQRRMISNRESARRSRMRKQKQLDELWSQMMRLRTENHALLDKFNHVFESHFNVVQENVKLRDEVSQLRKMVNDLQITCPETFLIDLEEIPFNQSISSSIDLLD
ncbi:unnamed protein product [Rhodiola kirilowii]